MILIKDEYSKQYFYRHSDGYPEVTGKSLTDFVEGYKTHMRDNVSQSCGWLVLHGYVEYREAAEVIRKKFSPEERLKIFGVEWKVGAYEPIDKPTFNAEYLYTIDLVSKTLACHYMSNGKKGKKCPDFETVSFKNESEAQNDN
jgi:hypothetical protein